MYFIFNELSVHNKLVTPVNKEKAKQIMNQFIDLIYMLKSKALLDGIVTTADIHNFMIGQDYGINEWLSDSSVDHNYKQFFRVLCSKTCSYIQESNFDNEFIININNKDYSGLGCVVAADTNGTIVSILTNEYWNQREIYGKYVIIDEDGNISFLDRSVMNVFVQEDLPFVNRIKQEKIYNNIWSGQDLWEQREKLFPELIFCESVKDQLYKDPEKFHILQIIEKLQRLQKYFENYEGVYDPKALGLSARTESETVKSSKTLKNMRRFRKPDGEAEYFYHHIGFSGKFSGGRIYFLPDDIQRKCYIGYIGRHLPTKNF